MNINVCQPNQYLQPVPVAVIDAFKSLIWTKRYYSWGDFELYIPADESLLPYLQKDNFLTRDDDDSVMIIESVNIQTDAENGDFFIITGRSLESILLRRVFDKPCSVKTSRYINDAMNSMLDYFTGDRRLLVIVDQLKRISGTVTAQFTGATLFDAIISVLQPLGLSFKLSFGTSLNLITLSLYQGSEVDVVFSPEFDNLINSKYVSDYTNYANYAFVAGEGEGSQRTVVDVNASDTVPTGLNRREVYVDARDISSNDGEISSSEYTDMLTHRGLEKFAEEYSMTESFEAEINPQKPFRYKADYNLGDIVTVTNEYGVTSHPRIVEIIESWDDTGYTVVPTFDALDVSSKTILRDSEGFVLRDSTGAIITVKE